MPSFESEKQNVDDQPFIFRLQYIPLIGLWYCKIQGSKQ